MHDSNKTLSLILVIRNSALPLGTWLEKLSLCIGDTPVEYIVVRPVGNAWIDEACSLLRPSKILEYAETPGDKLNVAAGLACGKYISVLYTDVVLKPATLCSLCALMDENDEFDLAFADLELKRLEDIEGDEGGFIPKAGRKEFADLLYEENPYIQIIWRRTAIHAENGFDACLDLFACRDFCLTMAAQKGILYAGGHAGACLFEKRHCLPEYKQYAYEEEMQVKERHVRRFLNSGYVFPALGARTLMHLKTVSLQLSRLKGGEFEDDLIQELDRHMFMYVLMLMKGGKIKDARAALYDYFNLIKTSRNCAHLYRILLTPFMSDPAVILPRTRETPLVSVPMALYNHGRYLDGAIRSLLAQTMPDWELVIINDGSTDNSLRIAKDLLKKYDDPRIRIISKPNEGVPRTRNLGMRETSATYICQLDADDFIAPDYLEKALAILEDDPEVGWVIPKTIMFGANNHLVWHWEYNFIHSLIKCPCPVLSVFRREAWEDCGGKFEAEMSSREDWEFWIRIGEYGWRAVTMDDVYFAYRHAFRRWSEQTNYNLSSKLDIVKLHKWWYRALSEEQLRQLFLMHKVGEFPPEILNPDVLARYNQLGRWDRETARKFMADLRGEERGEVEAVADVLPEQRVKT